VALLGNLPGHRMRLPLAARIRVNMEFTGDPIAQTPPPLTRNALMKWIKGHRHVVLFLLREYFLYVCARDYVADKLLSTQGVKWTDFKLLVRLANDEIRRELASQVSTDFFCTIRWAVLDISKKEALLRGFSTRDYSA